MIKTTGRKNDEGRGKNLGKKEKKNCRTFQDFFSTSYIDQVEHCLIKKKKKKINKMDK